MAHAHEPAHDDHGPLHEGDDLPAHGPVLAEPSSPAWLPFLGAAIAGLIIVWWLSTPTIDPEEAAAAAASASASAAAAAPTPVPEGQPKPAAPPSPPGGGGGAIKLPALKDGKVAPAVDINPHYKKQQ